LSDTLRREIQLIAEHLAGLSDWDERFDAPVHRQIAIEVVDELLGR
jgi:hypothetical protein